MKPIRLIPLLGALLAVAGAPAQAQQRTLIVSAAASMKDAMTEIGHDFEQRHPDVQVHFNFGASGALELQIEQGAPVDAFLSAADRNMNDLAAKGLLAKNTRSTIARNSLVLIVPAGSKLAIGGFGDATKSFVNRIAVGDPESVPAGKYAEQVFTRLKMWNAVLGRAVLCKDVRMVLTQVELGNVDVGVVYRTDAAITDKVRVVATSPEAWHGPIDYPAAVIAASHDQAGARALVNFLGSIEAKGVLKKFQFITP